VRAARGWASGPARLEPEPIPATIRGRGRLVRLTLCAAADKSNSGLRGGENGVRPGRREESAALEDLLREYLPILIFLGIAIALGLVLLLAAVVVAVSNPDPEKVSAYECGFNAFDDARMKFDVRFYLVSILFIIFDLEIAFLFPWAAAFGQIGMTAFWSMMVFLAVLTVGFAYEWKKGALEWE
jgi:NADH-quinone oxidoreductase subunit A